MPNHTPKVSLVGRVLSQGLFRVPAQSRNLGENKINILIYIPLSRHYGFTASFRTNSNNAMGDWPL